MGVSLINELKRFIEIEDGTYQGDNGKHYKGADKTIDNIDVIENTFHLRDARSMSYVTGGFGWDTGTFGISENGYDWNRYKKVRVIRRFEVLMR